MPRVSIIVLNWNNFKDTKECLESLEKISYPNYEIIIVDNGSVDGSGKEIQKIFPQYIYIFNDSNLGFTGGNNIGMKYALERGADYIFFINNDMIVNRGFLEPLVGVMGKEKAGIVGPAIYHYFQREKVCSAGIRLNFWKTKIKDYKFTGKLREVDALSGCFLIKKQVIDKIGFFYEPFFFNFEEFDYCFRARKAGFKIFCEPKSQIWHKVGGTLKKIPATAVYYFYRNRLLFIKRNLPFYIKYPLYLYWSLFLALRFLERLARSDKPMALSAKSALFDFWSGNFGKKN